MAQNGNYGPQSQQLAEHYRIFEVYLRGLSFSLEKREKNLRFLQKLNSLQVLELSGLGPDG